MSGQYGVDNGAMYPFSAVQQYIAIPQKREIIEWWVDTLDNEVLHTPDAFRVEQYVTQKVFIPDVFKRRENYNWAVRQAGQFRAPIWTAEKFQYWERTAPWDLPLPLTFEKSDKYSGVGPKPAQIMGELWEVSPNRLFYLDDQYKNGVEYERKRVDFILRTRELVSPTVANNVLKKDKEGRYYYEHNKQNLSEWKYDKVRAWMYVGIKKFWEDKIDNGYNFKPVKTFIPKSDEMRVHIPEYYHYTEAIK